MNIASRSITLESKTCIWSFLLRLFSIKLVMHACLHVYFVFNGIEKFSFFSLSLAFSTAIVVIIYYQGEFLRLWFSYFEQEFSYSSALFFLSLFFCVVYVPIRFSPSSHHSWESNECNPVFCSRRSKQPRKKR